MAKRLSLSGKDILLPDGRPIVLFGTNSRWELAQQRDGAYIKGLGCNAVRIEFPWWQTGSAGDSRMDGQPGNIDPAYLSQLDAQVAWYTGAGLWVGIAIHSKCGRSGADDGAGLGAYCGSVGPYASGHNFWNDPAEKAAHFVLLSFLADRYKNTDFMGWYEPINEPDPPGYTDVQVNAYYSDAIDAMLPGDPKALFLVGGNGSYLAAKISTALQAGRTNVMYTCDLFNQQNSAVDNAGRMANFANRLQFALDFRASSNVPILIQQFGAHSGDDLDRSLLAAQIAMLLANQVACIEWEMRTPTNVVGSAYGWIYIDPVSNLDVVLRDIDPQLMSSAAAAFNAFTPPLDPGVVTMPTSASSSFSSSAFGWTKEELIVEAFAEIGIASYQFDVSPEERQTALRRLDTMMATWEGLGIRMGYRFASTPRTSKIADPSGITDAAAETVYLNLAIRLAPGFGKTPSHDTKVSARAGYNALLIIAAQPQQQQFPSTLPLGAGNKATRRGEQRFFPQPSDDQIPVASGGDLDIL